MSLKSSPKKRNLTKPQVEVYVFEVFEQINTAQLSIGLYETALRQTLSADHFDKVAQRQMFLGVQAFLGACAIVSKLLYPNPPKQHPDGMELSSEEELKREFSLERGKTLRAIFLENQSKPLTLSNKKVRNGFEHIDERLDDYFLSAPQFVGHRLITTGHTIRIAGREPEEYEYLLFINPAKNEVAIMGEKVELEKLFEELQSLKKCGEAWMRENVSTYI